VCVGAAPLDEPIAIAPAALFTLQEKKLLGCALGSCSAARDIPRLLALHQAGRLDLGALITARRPLAEINDAMADLRAGRGVRTVLAC
jgi:Zn-dependent alcohol dehydrogenase